MGKPGHHAWGMLETSTSSHPHQPRDWAHQPHWPGAAMKGRPKAERRGVAQANPNAPTALSQEVKKGLSGAGGQGENSVTYSGSSISWAPRTQAAQT